MSNLKFYDFVCKICGEVKKGKSTSQRTCYDCMFSRTGEKRGPRFSFRGGDVEVEKPKVDRKEYLRKYYQKNKERLYSRKRERTMRG